jgi:hypothetical protein
VPVDCFEIAAAKGTHKLLSCSSNPSAMHTAIAEHARTELLYSYALFARSGISTCMTNFLPQDLELAAVYPMLAFNTDWLAVTGRRILNLHLPCMR